jgi:hypothetical protein
MLSLFAILLVGVLKALSDLSSEGVVFPKSSSWESKWYVHNHHLMPNKKKVWYYLWLYTPPFKERFPYSSTFLVSLTDSFHKIETLRIVAVIVAILGYKSFGLPIVAEFGLLWLVRTVGFSVVYEYFKRR